MVKNLLVGVAGTPALPAKIACSIELARRHHAEISIVSIVDVGRLSFVGAVPMGAGRYAQDMRKTRIERSHKLDEDAIEKFEAACASAGVAVRTIREEGPPLDILMAFWRYHDLCVLGVRGWFDYDVIPEPHDELLKLIASGVRPILTVNEDQRPIRRVLIAYNGSLESAKAMKHFVQMSLWPDMDIHIACVGKPKFKEKPRVVLEQAAKYCRLYGHDPVVTHVEGDVRNALLSHAAEIEADLIVLGSSYRRMLLRRRFGKNAIGLIKKSKIPLFLSH